MPSRCFNQFLAVFRKCLKLTPQAKKHPRFQLAMYPAYMWATINRDPHHVERCLLELTKQNAHLSWQCLETIHLGESSLPSQLYASNLQVGKNGVSKVLKLWMCFQLHRARYRSTRGWSKIHGTWLKRACSILQLNRVWKVDFGEFFGHVCFFGVCFLQFLHGKPSSSMFFRHAENWFWH